MRIQTMAARPYACVGVGGCISGPLQVNALYLHLGYLAVSIEVVATLAVHWNHLGGGGNISAGDLCLAIQITS